MIPEVTSLSLQPFFQTLAIIQTTVLSIIVAIYALSTQITAERYTTRAISSVTQNSTYRRTILLFTGSVFIDISALLVHQSLPMWLVWGLLLMAVLGVVLTFGSLFHLRDELLASSEASSVANAIRGGIGKDAFETEVEEDGTTIPFYNFFETGRSAIQEDDKDAANQLVVALCESTTELFTEVYSSKGKLSNKKSTGLGQLFSEMKSLAMESIDQGYNGITSYILQDLSSKIESSIENNQGSTAARGIQMCHDISEEVIQRDQLVKPAWLIWEDLLEATAQKGQEESLRVATTLTSDLIDISVENSDEFDGRKFTIASVLISALLGGWETLVENHGDNISEGDRVDVVPEFLWYRFFERNFEITSRIIVSRNADLQIPVAGMMTLQQDLIEELSDVAVAAAKIQNDFLAERLSKMVIEVGLGFDNSELVKSQIVFGLSKIESTNGCGESAVKKALSELQTPAEVNEEDEGIPIIAPWELNFINYTFEGQEGFIEAVGKIENEMVSDGDK